METYQMIGLICLVLAFAIIGGYPIVQEIKKIRDAAKGRQSTRELFRIYDQIWSGDPADRVTAWWRTIDYLQRQGFPEEMITEAKLHKMFEQRKGEKSEHKVTSAGRIIPVFENGKDPEAV